MLLGLVDCFGFRVSLSRHFLSCPDPLFSCSNSDEWRREKPAASADAPSNSTEDDGWEKINRRRAPRLALKKKGEKGEKGSPAKAEPKEEAVKEKTETPVVQKKEPEKPRAIKSKKIDPNAKLDPFGGARAKPVEELKPVSAKELKRTAVAAKAEKAAASTRQGERIDPFGGARPVAAASKKEDTPATAEPVVEEESKRASFDDLIENGDSLTVEELTEGIKSLDLDDPNVRARFAVSLKTSIVEKTVDFKVAVDTVKNNGEYVSSILTRSLEDLISSTSEENAAAVVKESGVDILQYIDEITASLACLATSEDCTDKVVSSITEGKSGADVVSLIKELVDEKIDPGFLAEPTGDAIFTKVFAGGEYHGDVLKDFEPVIAHVGSVTLSAQVEYIVQCHSAWFKAGVKKGQVKSAFEELSESKTISIDAFLFWKDDASSKNAPGKKKAIIQTISFVNALMTKKNTPVEVDEDEDVSEVMPTGMY